MSQGGCYYVHVGERLFVDEIINFTLSVKFFVGNNSIFCDQEIHGEKFDLKNIYIVSLNYKEIMLSQEPKEDYISPCTCIFTKDKVNSLPNPGKF